jgi:hypothetical protein
MAKRPDVTWTGRDAFEAALLALPATLTAEAGAILLAAAQEAKAAIVAAYPERTGNLRRGVVVAPVRGRVFAGARLRQRAPHGWLYEYGTKVRTNRAGQNRGRMQERPTFWPIAEAYQRTAYAAVIDRLYAHGATQVTGDIAA